MKISNAVFVFILLIVSSAAADEFKVPYEIVKGKVKTLGYVLEPKKALTEEHVDFDKFYDKSPDGRWIAIVFCDYDYNVNVWLYDAQSKARPSLIDTDAGRHVFIRWYGKDVLEVGWGGMGYRMSDLFELNNLRKKTHIDDPIYIDNERKIYVRYYFNYDGPGGSVQHHIVVGPAFSTIAKEEHFVVHLDIESLVDGVTSFENIEIKNDTLIVKYKKRDKSLVREEFRPQLLQKR